MKAAPRSIHVNRGYGPLAYGVDSASRASIDELIRLYNPIGGPVGKIANYLGPGGGLHVDAGHCAHYELDQPIQKLTGVPSLRWAPGRRQHPGQGQPDGCLRGRRRTPSGVVLASSRICRMSHALTPIALRRALVPADGDHVRKGAPALRNSTTFLFPHITDAQRHKEARSPEVGVMKYSSRTMQKGSSS